MENSQVYITPAASPAPNSLPFLPMTPMASTSESGCDTSSDRSPSTPGQTSDLPLRTSYKAEPIDEAQEFGDHNCNKINYPSSFSYDGYGALTPRCADQSCTCHNNSQADYFSLEPTQEIASTSSQGNYNQNQLENGPESSNSLLLHHPVSHRVTKLNHSSRHTHPLMMLLSLRIKVDGTSQSSKISVVFSNLVHQRQNLP